MRPSARHRTFASLFILSASALLAQEEVSPLNLEFHRQAVRRHLFSQEIPVGKLVPSETIALDSMHPSAITPGERDACNYQTVGSTLEITTRRARAGDSALYVSGIIPYGIYRTEIRSMSPNSELALEFASMDRQTRVQVSVTAASSKFLKLRLFDKGKVVRETVLNPDAALPTPYTLCVEFSGISVAVFAMKDGQTRFLGNATGRDGFGDVRDFRSRAIMADSTFNLATRLPVDGRVVTGETRCSLSSGMGQADIRMITHADGVPFIEGHRYWFTFSCRGLDTTDSWQGVMSLDPSVFDPRFEGIIVFDRQDGLLRNDYASHVFYDDESREWRAVTCCFSADAKGRGATGLALARSSQDPRRGFSVMSEGVFPADRLPGRHEDPCIVYDRDAGKWRLLTSSFDEGIRATMYESDEWNGPYAKIAGPVDFDSTGTLIQKIGSKRYVFSGTEKGPSGKGGVLICSYPDLSILGEMKVDLPATLKGGRIWPGVFPLPPGYPARYMALTMDRANFPGVRGANWSYGALYLFWANTPQINGPYEFDDPTD